MLVPSPSTPRLVPVNNTFTANSTQIVMAALVAATADVIATDSRY